MRRRKTPGVDPEKLMADWVRDHGEAVTVKEAAELLSVHPQTIYRQVSAGKLGYTPNKRVRVRDLCAYANGL